MTRKFIFHHDGVHYYRLSVYRMRVNVQSVYTFLVDDVLIDTGQRYNRGVRVGGVRRVRGGGPDGSQRREAARAPARWRPRACVGPGRRPRAHDRARG